MTLAPAEPRPDNALGLRERFLRTRAESGRASHAVYKAAQAKMAMRRVLGQLLPAERDTQDD